MALTVTQLHLHYRLLKVSDDSFLSIAITSLNSNELQAAFGSCFDEIMSRQVTASESVPAGHMNLSSRNLAIQVNDTLKCPNKFRTGTEGVVQDYENRI